MPRSKSQAVFTASAASALFQSYVQLTQGLLEDVTGICLLDRQLRCLGVSGGLKAPAVTAAIQIIIKKERLRRGAHSIDQGPRLRVTIIPLAQTDGALLGFFCVQQQSAKFGKSARQYAASAARTLRPVLDCLHRELAAAWSLNAKVRLLIEVLRELGQEDSNQVRELFLDM
jgi:hypothetical protein